MGECGGRVDILVFFSHIALGFFMLLSQPVLLYKKERPIACRQSRLCVRARVHVCVALTVTLNALTRRGAFSSTEFRRCVKCWSRSLNG